MRLIGKTGLLGDIGDQRPFAQLRLGMLNAPIDQIGVGRHMVTLLEGTDQVSLRQAGGGTDILQANGVQEMLVDKFGGALHPCIGALAKHQRAAQFLLHR